MRAHVPLRLSLRLSQPLLAALAASLCASLLFFVCLASLAWAETVHKRSSGAPPAASPGPLVRAPRDALLGAVDEITRQVAALRGLPLKTPFKRGVLSREEIG